MNGRMQRRRTGRMLMMTSFLIGVMAFATVAFAGEKIRTGNYGGFELTCTSICKAGSGTAMTTGATKPYYNYASVVIYGQNGESQGTTYGRGGPTATQSSATATATVNGTNLSRAMTYHAVQTESGSFTDGFINQLVYPVDR